LPDALAVINPKRADCAYPDKNLAGVGVALKLVQALCGRTGRERWVHGFLKLAALGTLADVVPLVGENRVTPRAWAWKPSRPVRTKPACGLCSRCAVCMDDRWRATPSRSSWRRGLTPPAG